MPTTYFKWRAVAQNFRVKCSWW